MRFDRLYPERPIVLFSGIWFILNFIQAYFTELSGDEAYYVTFAQHLDWGYFDHPPMVAVFIYLSSLIFEGELGVRFLSVLTSTLSLGILASFLNFKTHKKNIYLFAALAFSSTMFSFYGFLATPDVPLIFFGSLFLWTIKRYLYQSDWKNSLFLAFSMAALLYSKYHGIILIALFVLANPKVLKKSSFYGAAVLGALLFTPHLWWQYQQGFPSISYHLSGHSSNNWSWKFVFEYPIYQLLVLGPFVAIPVLIAMFKFKAEDAFERSLLYFFWGFLIFFFLMSFKTHVEPHWTVLMALPALIIVPKYYANHAWRKWIIRLAVANAVLLLLTRFLISSVEIPKSHFWGNKEWVNAIAQKSEGQPVVFYGSYQEASLFEFYTGTTSHSYNPYYYHHTQFDLCQKENELRHQKVYFVSKQKLQQKCDSIETIKGLYYGYWIENYYSLQGLRFSIIDEELFIKPQQEFVLKASIFNPYNFEVDLLDEKYALQYTYLASNSNEEQTFGKATLSTEKAIIPPLSSMTFEWKLANISEGSYFLTLIPSSVEHPLGMGSQSIILYCED